MYVASIAPRSDAAAVRRALTGVPEVDTIVLPHSEDEDRAGLVATFGHLRRELFLRPELQVLMSVGSLADSNLLGQLLKRLVESRLGDMSVGLVLGEVVTQLAREWQREGRAFLDVQSGRPMPTDGTIQRARVQFGAAPAIEAVQSSARLIITNRLARGSLALAAAFEALQLGPQDWDRLATAATCARIVENAASDAPLWLEVDEDGVTYLVDSNKTRTDDSQQQIARERDQFATGCNSPEVTIDLSGCEIIRTRLGRWLLHGIKGSPPTGTYTLDIDFHGQEPHFPLSWATSIERRSVEWRVEVRSAWQWLDDLPHGTENL